MSDLRKRFVLQEYLLVPEQRLLTRQGETVHLARKPFDVLLYLINHRDRFVSRTELLDRFWEGQDVYDDALRKCIGAVRKALNDQNESPRFIETRWGVGYRYIGPAEEQVVHEETTVTEVEKIRALRLVVEEEDVHDNEPATDQIRTAGSRVRFRLPSPRTRNAFIAAALAVLAVAFTVLAILSYRSRQIALRREIPAIRSIVVLPLRNLSGDPADDYLSDGITETLIASLSRSGGLKVISRGSSFAFKNRDVDPREIGKLVGVDSLLEGSVRRSGARVRVEVRLVSTSDGAVLWEGNTLESNVADIFTIEDRVTREVASRLSVSGGKGGDQQLVKRYTNNVEAYEACLKGRYFMNQRTQEDIEKGLAELRRAVELDPNYALAYAWLAEGYETEYWFSSGLPPAEIAARQREAAARALLLDDSLPDAHLGMAIVYRHALDLPNTAKEQQRAIELNAGAAEPHHGYAYTLVELGRANEAVSEILLARELDPLNIVMNVDVGEILLYAGRYSEAIEALKHAVEMDPTRANAHYDLGLAYERSGMEREAVEEYLKDEALNGGQTDVLKRAYAESGVVGFWRKKFELLTATAKERYIAPITMARLQARLGDIDRAFDWLEKAYAERSPMLADLRTDPALYSLHQDPRYEQFLRRVGLQLIGRR